MSVTPSHVAQNHRYIKDLEAQRYASRLAFQERQATPFGLDNISRPDPQAQSRLLSLPPEVREIILTHACGRYDIHCGSIGTGERRVGVWLGRADCQEPPLDPEAQTNPGADERELPTLVWATNRPVPKGEPSILNYLLVCKQSYLEAASLIFTENTFHLHDAWSIFDLASTLPKGRAKQVRNVNLTFDHGSQRRLFHVGAANALWRQMWPQFASDFSGLRDVEIVFKVRFLQQMLKFTRFSSVINALTTLSLGRVKFRAVVHYPNEGDSAEQVAADAALLRELGVGFETACMKKPSEPRSKEADALVIR